MESPKEGRRGALLAQTDDGKELTKVALEEKGRRKSATMEEILASAILIRGDKMKRESREEEDRKISTGSWDDNFEEDKKREHVSRSPMLERVEEITKQEEKVEESMERKSSERMKKKKSVMFDDVVTDISEGETTRRNSTISEGYGGSGKNSLVMERLSEFTKQDQEDSKQNGSLSRTSSSEGIYEEAALRAEKGRGHSRTPSSSSFVPPTHSIAEESENESDEAEEPKEEKPLPAWKRALMERRQKKEEEEVKDESSHEDKSRPVSMVGEDGKPLPTWKAAMYAKRQEKEESAKRDEERRKELEESKYKGVPAWKRKLMEKKSQEREAKERKQQKKNQEMEDKLNEIRSMPQWKRDIFLQKNPEYVDKL